MGWQAVAVARHDFGDTIAGLTPEQLDGETLCEGWSPRLVIHHQDVRRSLGIRSPPSPEHIRTSLGFLTTNRRAPVLLETKGLLDGLRFEATDLDWSWGDGGLVSGPGESILMALNRRDTIDELAGEGVSTLQARLAGD